MGAAAKELGKGIALTEIMAARTSEVAALVGELVELAKK